MNYNYIHKRQKREEKNHENLKLILPKIIKVTEKVYRIKISL